jgi:arylsulfatase A-like enzyme
VIKWLREHDVLDDTLVVITSDHGETMHEHRFEEVWDHGESVFDTTIHTPLIIRFPGAWGAGTQIPQLLSNIDVMPTLLELLGLPVPARVEGLSFRAAIDGEDFSARPYTFSEATKPATADYESGRRWLNELKPTAIRTARHKLIWHPKLESWRLHDLQIDPAEQKPLDGGDRSAVKERLAKQLIAWSDRADPLESRRNDDPADQKLLEALGYVEGKAEPPDLTSKPFGPN